MEEELDLRRLVLTLVRRWKIIAAVTVIVLAAAALMIVLGRPKFEATALVAITAVDTENLPFGTVTAKAYTLIATGKELENRILHQLGWDIPLEQLELGIKVKADTGVIQFVGTDSDPDKAAELSNTWARLYVDQLNEIFDLSAPDLTVLEAQVEQSQTELDNASQALADFQAANQLGALQQQVEAASKALQDRLALMDRFDMLAGNARNLKQSLEAAETDTSSAAGQFQALVLEALAANPQTEPPLQLQISVDGATLSSASRAELVQDLDRFAKSLDLRVQEVGTEADALPAKIATLQTQLEGQQGEYDRLSAARDVAKESYAATMTRLDEEQLAAALRKPEARLISTAAVPAEPASPASALIIGLGLIGGVILGAIIALVVEHGWTSTG